MSLEKFFTLTNLVNKTFKIIQLILYPRFFRPEFFTLLHLLTVSHLLEFAQTQLEKDTFLFTQFLKNRFVFVQLTTRVIRQKIKRGKIFPCKEFYSRFHA